jgi:hypothetical protein
MALQSTGPDAPEATGMVIRKTVTVPLSQKAAFKLFTEGMGTWWPALTHWSPSRRRQSPPWTTGSAARSMSRPMPDG